MKLKLSVFAAALLLPLMPAKADPFVLEKGKGRVIATTVLTDSSRGFDDDGNNVDINNYDQEQVYLNIEYGLTDDLTVVVHPSFRKVSVENDENTSGLGYTEIGARYRLAHGPNWLVSTQALVRIPGKGRSDRIAQVGNSSTDFDARIGAAYSNASFFTAADGGYRFRSGDLPNEFHADLTAGINVTDKVLLLATSANTFSDGRGEGIFNDKYKYGDAYLSAAYRVAERVTLQVGYTATIYGRNSLRQRGPLFGIWFEF